LKLLLITVNPMYRLLFRCPLQAVDHRGGTLSVSSSRSLPCPAEPKLAQEHGAVGTVRSVRKAFATTAKNAGIKATPHILRHTAAAWAMQNGGDPWQVSGYLGMTVETLTMGLPTEGGGGHYGITGSAEPGS
jgi:integrase